MKSNSHYALSISDLLMGILFIFMLILMKFMMEYQNKKESLLEPLSERVKILKHLKSEIEKKNIKVEIDKKNGILKLTGAHYFDSGKYELSDEGKKDFEKIKDIFTILICYSALDNKKTKERWPKNKKCKSNLKKWQDHCKKKYPKKYALIDSILIEGHADADPIADGSCLAKEGIKNNLDLAMKRAQEIFIFLLDYIPERGYDPIKGPPAPESGNCFYALVNKQDKPLFGVASYGNLRRSDKSQDKVKGLDRRVDFRFIMSQPEDITKELTAL